MALSGATFGSLPIAGDRLSVDRSGAVLAAHGVVVHDGGCNRPDGASTFTFSSRTASALNVTGGSIAVSASNCNRWFWNMSRTTPASS